MQGPAELDARGHDLQQLQAGAVRAAKKVRLTRAMREEAFERYLRRFYKQQPRVEVGLSLSAGGAGGAPCPPPRLCLLVGGREEAAGLGSSGPC